MHLIGEMQEAMEFQEEQEEVVLDQVTNMEDQEKEEMEHLILEEQDLEERDLEAVLMETQQVVQEDMGSQMEIIGGAAEEEQEIQAVQHIMKAGMEVLEQVVYC